MSGALVNIYNNVRFALGLHAEALSQLQEQAYTGSRINRASDDPSAAYRVLGLNSQGRSLENYMDNISKTIETLEISLATITKLTESLLKTRELLASVTGTDGTIGQAIHAAVANDYLDDLVLFANWEHTGQYLFGGDDTGSAPYAVQRTNGKITSVTYQGSLEDRDIEIASGVQSSAFYVGDSIFRSNDRSAPEFILGNTGAAAGSGTSSVTGYTWLNVTYNIGTGKYELYIDDSDNPVVVEGADIANLAVTNLAGEVLYVNGEGINSTGVELVSVSGTHDIFGTLITLRQVLENENEFTSGQVQTLRDNCLEAVEEVSELLLQVTVSAGSEIGFLENIKDGLEDIKFATEDETTRLEEADIAQIAIELSRHEVLYQMSLAVAGRLMSMSLLDFIR